MINYSLSLSPDTQTLGLYGLIRPMIADDESRCGTLDRAILGVCLCLGVVSFNPFFFFTF